MGRVIKQRFPANGFSLSPEAVSHGKGALAALRNRTFMECKPDHLAVPFVQPAGGHAGPLTPKHRKKFAEICKHK